MIHFVVGTKAQLVKIAPVMMELRERKIPYNFIFTGQHQETMERIRSNFDIKDPDITLHHGKDITSVVSMFFWLIKIVFKTLTSRKQIFKGDKKGIVLVHGDTFSTLLGAIMGKLAGHKVAHVESGLRSFNLFHPFPEEITRLLTFRLSDIYLCPGEWAVKNLESHKGQKIDTEYNTLLDSLRQAIKNFDTTEIEVPKGKYAICTTHRFENIFKKETFEKNLDLIEGIAKKIKVVFILHPVTEKKLKEFSLLDRLEKNGNIELRPRYDYFEFMKLVYHSDFVISDGGSNQEECFYMGKPCLLLRKTTERQEGLSANVVISEYKQQIVDKFLNEYQKMKGGVLDALSSPVKIIVDNIESYQ